MSQKTNEADWTTFRELVPELRERHLSERNKDLMAILEDDSHTHTERFWTVSERAGETARLLRACFDGHTRSKMLEILLLMYRYGILSHDDLRKFSEDLQAKVIELSKF